jgi:hypothetical protein
VALVEADQFADRECARIYIAGRLREARNVEQTLTNQGIDYFVEIERYERLLFGLIRREYDGVAFYVPSEVAASCRALLRVARLTAGLETDEG